MHKLIDQRTLFSEKSCEVGGDHKGKVAHNVNNNRHKVVHNTGSFILAEVFIIIIRIIIMSICNSKRN